MVGSPGARGSGGGHHVRAERRRPHGGSPRARAAAAGAPREPARPARCHGAGRAPRSRPPRPDPHHRARRAARPATGRRHRPRAPGPGRRAPHPDHRLPPGAGGGHRGAAAGGSCTQQRLLLAGTPQTAHGLATDEVTVESAVGHMPAWLVRPSEEHGSTAGNEDTWAILIHGHGSARGEALRVIPLLHRLGLTSLAITYRNDVGAPASADRMHHLGSAEWEDTEAAIDFARAHGARRIVLMGWSMGGGIALRTSVRSAHREHIAALVLDSPAVDWQDILIYHATALKAPAR